MAATPARNRRRQAATTAVLLALTATLATRMAEATPGKDAGEPMLPVHVGIFGGAHVDDMTKLFRELHVPVTVRPLDALATDSLDPYDAVFVTAAGYPSRPTILSSDAVTNLQRFLGNGKRAYVEFAVSNQRGLLPAAGAPVVAPYERIVVNETTRVGSGLDEHTILDEHHSSYLPITTESGSEIALTYAKVAGVHTAVFGLPGETHPALVLIPRGPGTLAYASTALSNFVQGRHAPVGAWKQVMTNLAIELLPEHVRQQAHDLYTPLNAYTQPRVWAEPDTPVTLTVEAKPNRTITASDQRGKNITLREHSPGVYVSETIQLPKGHHTFTVRDTHSVEPVTVELTVQSRHDAYRSMLERAAKWYQQSGVLFDKQDGSAAVAEGFGSEIGPDGKNPFKDQIRGDGITQSAHALELYGQLTGDDTWRQIARNINDQVFERMQIPSRNSLYGLWETRGYWTGEHGPHEFVYRDDEGWISLLTQAWGHRHRNEPRFVQGLRSAENLYRTANVDTGVQTYIGHASTLLRTNWEHVSMVDVDERFGSIPHYQSMPQAALFHAYATTGEQKYLTRALQSVDFFMSQFPDIGMEKSRSEEYGRALLPLAAAYRYSGDEKYAHQMSKIADFFVERQDSLTGAIPEWDGVNPKSNEEYGTYESTVIQENGDPITDQLYTTGFLAMNLWIAYKATGDERFRELELNLLDYLSRIQLRSADPTLDGTWMRAFDFDNWEYYGSGADIGWGPYAIETGWAHAPIMIGTLLYLHDDAFYPEEVTNRPETAAMVGGEFDGIAPTLPATQYLRVDHASALQRPESSLTLEAWIRPDQTAINVNHVGVVSKSTMSLWLRSGNLYGEFLSTGAGWITVQSSAALPVDTWSHVAMTYDGTRLTLWFNGHPVAERRVAGLRLHINDRPLTIGAHNPHDLYQGYFFTGLVDEVRVSDIAREAEEFNVRDGQPTEPYERDAATIGLFHFNDADDLAADESGHRLQGRAIGSPGWTATGLFNGSLSLVSHREVPERQLELDPLEPSGRFSRFGAR
ncbi:hypothetical protein GCM10012275_16580 [Longimycelium tulufanense]|uniref:LamG-like jellyroll fold domain-containing protein n=1 Tax=Longimycelium tulufanense TaxID=907463 RepID=A0A8J3FU10_9PSEU|nr:LamG-like jellyroll fold domain-containing protein [Longimycelium tulufanense]GGM46240.1 hypothetical protein GCM10012275_16580 [Longimycelium tulufanense]